MLKDEYTKRSINKIRNILVDLLSTSNDKLLQEILNHKIWKLILNSVEENNLLLPTIEALKSLH